MSKKRLKNTTTNEQDTQTRPQGRELNIHIIKSMKSYEKLRVLIPGLPDHIAQLCLSKIHPIYLYPVCSLWRDFIYSPLFPPFLCLYAVSTPTHCKNVTPIVLSCFEPIGARWRGISPPPDPSLRLLLRHPSFISRNIPIQSVTVGDKLVVVAATNEHLLPALPRPLVFDPLAVQRVEQWGYGPNITVPRRWCAAGGLSGSVYVASGVGSHFSTDTARSVEKCDLSCTNNIRSHFSSDTARSVEKCDLSCRSNIPRWEKTRPLRDGRFSRESVDAVGWKQKLCMVNVKGDAAKQGAVYDSATDQWSDMAEGMLNGWRGPAAAMNEEVIYVADVSKGVLRKYDEVRDVWVDVLKNEKLRGAKQMAARGGRVCVVCGGGVEVVVVDVVAVPARMWVVQSPVGFDVVSVHILPRMSVCSQVRVVDLQ